MTTGKRKLVGPGHIVSTSGATFAGARAGETFAGPGGSNRLEQARQRSKIDLFEAETAPNPLIRA